jgi:hypothetical protein
MNLAKKNKSNYNNPRTETELNWEAFLSLRKLLFVKVNIFVLFMSVIIFMNIIIVITTFTTTIVLYVLRRCIIFTAYFIDDISYSFRSCILTDLRGLYLKILFYVRYRSCGRAFTLASQGTQYFLVLTL